MAAWVAAFVISAGAGAVLRGVDRLAVPVLVVLGP